jgi:ATP synthase protein I
VPERPAPRERPREDPLIDTVGRKEARKVRDRRRGRRGLAYGLGMFGVVGWSVALPTVLGIALGVWIDSRTASPYSWTLMLMLGGLILGCFNAWYWVRREMERE